MKHHRRRRHIDGEPTPCGRQVQPVTGRAPVPTGLTRNDWLRTHASPICLSLTLAGVAIWAATSCRSASARHRNFHTLAYDMAIWDQAFWLVAEGGPTWITVRGLDVWAQHLSLVAYVFVPFCRWLEAGPEYL